MLQGNLSRRELLRLTGLAAGAVALAACQPTTPAVQEAAVEPGTDADAPVAAPAQQEVRFLSDPTPEELKLAVPEMDAFQDATGIRVRLEPLPGGLERLLAGLAAGTAPDVFGQWGPGMRSLIERGQCLNLDSLVARDGAELDMDDFVESQIEAATYEGSLFGMPQYCGIWAGYYHKTLFDEEGIPYPDKETWSYDQYLDAGQRITKRDDRGRPSQLGMDEWFGFEFVISTNIWSWGGEVHDPDDNRICRLSEDKAIAAMEWLADLRWEHRVAGTPAENSAIDTEAGGHGLFGSGRVGMKPEGSWGAKGYMDAIGDRFEYGVMPHHRGPDGERVTFSTTDEWMINAQTALPDAAWEWLKWITGPSYQRMRIQIGRQPNRRSLAPEWVDWASEYAKSQNPAADQDWNIFVEGFDYARPMVFFNRHTDAMEILRPVLDQIYAVGEVKAREVIPDVCRQITDLLVEA